MAVAPFYAYHDPQSGDFYEVPETQATHYYDGRGFQRYSPGGTPASVPTMGAPQPPISGLTPMGAEQPTTPEGYQEYLRNLVVSRLMPFWSQALLTGLGPQQELANASPQGILRATGAQAEPAIQQAQAQRRTTSQRLGPSAGPSGRAVQGGINAQLAQLLAQLYGAIPGEARQGLIPIGQRTPTIPQEPRTNTGIRQTEGQVDPLSVAMGLTGAVGLGQGISRLWPKGGLYPQAGGEMTSGPLGYGGGAPGFFYP